MSLRIALISSSYHPFVGGVETTVRALATHLERDGHTIEVWTVNREGKSVVRVLDGIVVRELPAPLPRKHPRGALAYVRDVRRARAEWATASAEFHPDILHVHCAGPNGVYARMLHRRTGAPLVLTTHGEVTGDDHDVFARSLTLRRSLSAAVADSAVVTAPSRASLEVLRDRFGLIGGEVIPNGVDLDEPEATDTRCPPCILAVGRLGKPKGFDLLVEAFADAALAPHIPLVIAGDGPQRAALAAQIAAAGLEDRVHLVGMLPPERVAERMASAVAVVVPSRSEAFGLVGLEAWRSGAPLIMTSRGGGSEIVTDGVDGLIVDPCDRGALAHALRRLATDDQLRASLRAAGARRVRDFTWADAAARYGRIYGRVRAQR